MNRKVAKFCIDCEEIYDMTVHYECPVCTSQRSWMLANWIGSIDSIKPKKEEDKPPPS